MYVKKNENGPKRYNVYQYAMLKVPASGTALADYLELFVREVEYFLNNTRKTYIENNSKGNLNDRGDLIIVDNKEIGIPEIPTELIPDQPRYVKFPIPTFPILSHEQAGDITELTLWKKPRNFLKRKAEKLKQSKKPVGIK